MISFQLEERHAASEGGKEARMVEVYRLWRGCKQGGRYA